MVPKYFVSLLALATVPHSLAQILFPTIDNPSQKSVWPLHSVHLVKWHNVSSDLDSASAMLYLTHHDFGDLVIQIAYAHFPLNQSVYEIQVPSNIQPGDNYAIMLECIKKGVSIGNAYSERFRIQ